MKEKFKGYSIAAWLVLVGGTILFGYAIYEFVAESYEDWKIPAGVGIGGFILMRYPSLIAGVFKLKTGLKNEGDAG